MQAESLAIAQPAGQLTDHLAADPGRPLRIALLGYRSQPFSGGQGIYLHYLSKALVEQGHQVDVISGPPYPHLDPRVRLIQIPSLDLFENGLPSLRPRHLRSLSNIIEWTSKLTGGFAEPYTFGRRVVKYLRQHGQDYDVIHDNQALCHGLLDIQRDFPLLETIHHPVTSDFELALQACTRWYEPLLVRRWYNFLRMQKHVAPRLSHVVTVSECSMRDIEQALKVPRARMHLVHNGIPTDVFRPLPGAVRLQRRLMTTASSDQPLKGLRFLLEALAQLLPRYPELELLVIGKPKPGGDTEQLVERLGIGRHVRFVKGIPTDELVQYYNQATLAIAPSLYEGFGLPAGEAMACGTPVVSSDGGALPEVVGNAGVIVPAGNSQALAAAIAGLLDNPEKRAQLGAAGRRRIVESFSWEVAARAMVKLYREVIAAHGNR